MRILHVGPLLSGSTCLQRKVAMQDLGHEVVCVDTVPLDMQIKRDRFSYRLIHKIFGPVDFVKANQKIKHLIKGFNFDILWLDKSLTIKPNTLEFIKKISPKTFIAGYSPDNMALRHNQSRDFINGLRYYDIYFTTKSFIVDTLKTIGCPSVVFVNNAYDPHTHRPMTVAQEERRRLGGPVGFIGTYEPKKAEMLLYLAENGINVRVWGSHWNKCKLSHTNLIVENMMLIGDEYAKAICSFDINLGLLSKRNHDLQTTRSVEIPACGAFLLAERTNEHLQLFQESKEAEFFGAKEELLEKIKYYLAHEDERKHIAANGLKRCLEGGYSYQERIKAMFKIIEDKRTI